MCETCKPLQITMFSCKAGSQTLVYIRIPEKHFENAFSWAPTARDFDSELVRDPEICIFMCTSEMKMVPEP